MFKSSSEVIVAMSSTDRKVVIMAIKYNMCHSNVLVYEKLTLETSLKAIAWGRQYNNHTYGLVTATKHCMLTKIFSLMELHLKVTTAAAIILSKNIPQLSISN